MPAHLTVLLVSTPLIALAALACVLAAKPGVKSMPPWVKSLGACLTATAVVCLLDGVIALIREPIDPPQQITMWRVDHVYLPFGKALGVLCMACSMLLGVYHGGSTSRSSSSSS